MIHDIPKLDISEHFTIDDIHKIREWHYEILKDATVDEQIAFYNNKANKVEEEMCRAIEEIRAAKNAKAV
jgi:hypothetical protein